MRQVIKHRDIRLLKMIRRTDPVIPNNQFFEEKNNYFTIIFPQNDDSYCYYMYQIFFNMARFTELYLNLV
jgi:hypothetical protein